LRLKTNDTRHYSGLWGRMSQEGVALLTKAAFVAVLIMSGAVVRTLVGPSRRRGLIMGAGTLGGLSLGVAVASLLPRWVGHDILAICAPVSMMLGWVVAWSFARHVPREGT
jgi:hypothetical protein